VKARRLRSGFILTFQRRYLVRFPSPGARLRADSRFVRHQAKLNSDSFVDCDDGGASPSLTLRGRWLGLTPSVASPVALSPFPSLRDFSGAQHIQVRLGDATGKKPHELKLRCEENNSSPRESAICYALWTRLARRAAVLCDYEKLGADADKKQGPETGPCFLHQLF